MSLSESLKTKDKNTEMTKMGASMERRTSGTGWRLDWIPELHRLRAVWDKSGIYYLLCKPTRVGYIGSAKQFSQRLKYHFGDLATKSHINRKMQSAFNEYGIDNFTWGVVEECPIHALEEREQYWINRYTPDRLFNIELKVNRTRSDIRIPKEQAAKYAQEEIGFEIEALDDGKGWIDWHLVTDMSLAQRYTYWFPFWLPQEHDVALAGIYYLRGVPVPNKGIDYSRMGSDEPEF